MKIAVFLDRDGTLNEERGDYISKYEDIKIYPFAFNAIRIINSLGFLAIVTTNQAGIAKGILRKKDVDDIHRKMKEDFERNNAKISAFYYCPAHPDHSKKGLNCRKPLIGMALKAKKEFGVDLKKSFVIGDKVEDILFAKNFGGKGILVLTGYGRKSMEEIEKIGIEPDFIAENVLKAVEWIREKFNE